MISKRKAAGRTRNVALAYRNVKLYVMCMPRERSENTEAINLKIPKKWIAMAKKLAAANRPVKATRTAILRVALGQGLEAMHAQLLKDGKKKRGKTES